MQPVWQAYSLSPVLVLAPSSDKCLSHVCTCGSAFTRLNVSNCMQAQNDGAQQKSPFAQEQANTIPAPSTISSQAQTVT